MKQKGDFFQFSLWNKHVEDNDMFAESTAEPPEKLAYFIA